MKWKKIDKIKKKGMSYRDLQFSWALNVHSLFLCHANGRVGSFLLVLQVPCKYNSAINSLFMLIICSGTVQDA